MEKKSQYINEELVPRYTLTDPHENKEKKFIPTRFWKWLNESNFESNSFQTIAQGNFGLVKKAKFNKAQFKQDFFIYADTWAALKYPLGSKHNFQQQFNSLSHEVSCTIILHPNLVNYIGGLYLGEKAIDPIGVVMEFVHSTLRNAIEKDPRLKIRNIQLQIAKQISSGMNFLHSLNPHILHRDLRTPNILLTENLECKIADFGISDNLGYNELTHNELYTNLIPPECRGNDEMFTSKSDVYFFGWILVELLLGQTPDGGYNVSELTKKLNQDDSEKQPINNIILTCLNMKPKNRPSFRELCVFFNTLLNINNDIELIAQGPNSIKQLDSSIFSITDSLGRTLVHQYCIFGNLTGLKELISLKGKECLEQVDKYNTNCAHFAGRNGHLEILKFLEEQTFSKFNEKENRFQTSALTLAIAMKHMKCVEFLASHANQESLNLALISLVTEGNLELVKFFLSKGADIHSHDLDITGTPLFWASYAEHLTVAKYLLEKGANINYGRNDTQATPLYVAASHGTLEIVQFLIENGADFNYPRTDGSTPIYVASENGHLEIVKLLIEKGANPNQKDMHGMTPLIIASYNNHREIVKFLLEKGADPNQEDSKGRIASDFAAYKKNVEIVELLKGYSESY